jgi:tRNA (guanine-N7-)-methyltransferase
MSQKMANQRPLSRIKSFVRREGRLTASQQRALEKFLPIYGIDPDSDQEIDLHQLFGDQRPVTLEIGFGNGDLLAQLAQRHPDRGYIGAEVHRPGVGYLLNLVETHQLTNVRVYNDDVMRLLDRLPYQALNAVHLFYPDPWPKKKHHKRRLVTLSWLEKVAPRLQMGAVVHMATDWEDYANQMLEVMESHPHFTNRAGAGCFHERPAWRPITKFERRGDRLGHGQWDLIYTYTPPSLSAHASP